MVVRKWVRRALLLGLLLYPLSSGGIDYPCECVCTQDFIRLCASPMVQDHQGNVHCEELYFHIPSSDCRALEGSECLGYFPEDVGIREPEKGRLVDCQW